MSDEPPVVEAPPVPPVQSNDEAIASLIRTHRDRMQSILDMDRRQVMSLGQVNNLAIYLGSLGKDPDSQLSKKLREHITQLVVEGIVK